MNDYKKRSALNIITDLGGKILILIVGIILPKLYIESFGSDTNGLVSSINNILVYVNLLEAGIGGAATQSLYAVITKKDKDGINGILSATNKFYRRTGIYFILLVCIAAVIYPYCVKTELSFGLVSSLIFLSAIPAAIKYFFQGKYTILLNADNRAYIINTISLITTLLTNFTRIILILFGVNIIVVQASYAIASMIQLLFIYVFVRKKYKFLDLSVKPNVRAIDKSKYVFVHTISATIFSNIDVLVLTFFCDLKTVSIYSVYQMIFLQINQMIKGIPSGTSASFGQLYSTDRVHFSQSFTIFKIGYRFIAGSILLAASVSVLPFIRIYAKDFSDANYVNLFLPTMFFLSNYLDVIRWPEVIVVNCTGFFKETARQAITETAINLILSIGLVYKLQIYGVLFATASALAYRTVDFFIFVSKNLTKEGYIRDIAYMLFSTFTSVIVILSFERFIPVFYSWIGFFVYGMVSVVICGILYIFIIGIFYRGKCVAAFKQITRIVSNKLKH